MTESYMGVLIYGNFKLCTFQASNTASSLYIISGHISSLKLGLLLRQASELWDALLVISWTLAYVRSVKLTSTYALKAFDFDISTMPHSGVNRDFVL